MMQDLAYLRSDLFGFGWIFAIWLAGSLGLMAWALVRHGAREAIGYLPVLALIGAVIIWVLPALAGEQGLPIRGYGAMLVLGIVAGVWLGTWLGSRFGIDPEVILGMSFWVILSGIAGARAFYVLQYWHDFQAPTLGATLRNVANVTEGGLVVYGGAIGGFAAMAVYLLIHRLPALAIADVCAPAIGLGLFFGRIGCFLNGCCYGGVCELPWAVQFPVGSPPYRHQLERGEVGIHGLQFEGGLDDSAKIARVAPGSPVEAAGARAGERVIAVNGVDVANVGQAIAELLRLKPSDVAAITVAGQFEPKTWTIPDSVQRSLPIHPTQLYSALDGLVICVFLLAYFPYRRRDGEAMAWLLTIYPITRFLIEMLRDDELGIGGTGLTISQNVSLVCLGLAGLMWLYLSSRPRGSMLPQAVPAK